MDPALPTERIQLRYTPRVALLGGDSSRSRYKSQQTTKRTIDDS
jgi:hypothetical protein